VRVAGELCDVEPDAKPDERFNVQAHVRARVRLRAASAHCEPPHERIQLVAQGENTTVVIAPILTDSAG
jgi:hypothetical protein